MRVSSCCGSLTIEIGDDSEAVKIEARPSKKEVERMIRELIDYAREIKWREKNVLTPGDYWSHMACVLDLGTCWALWSRRELSDDEQKSCGFAALLCCIVGVREDCYGVDMFNLTLDDVIGWR